MRAVGAPTLAALAALFACHAASCGDDTGPGGSGGAGGPASVTASTQASGTSGGGEVGGAGGSQGGAGQGGAGGSAQGGMGGGGGAGQGGAGQGGAGQGGAGQGGAGGSAQGGMGGGGAGQGGAGQGGAGQGGAGGCDGDPQGGVDQPDVVLQLPDVVVTTVAGSATSGAVDGTGSLAAFNNPVNLIEDGFGGFFIADFDNGRVRALDLDGNVTTLTADATFARPFGLALGATGQLFVQTDYDELGMSGGIEAGVVWEIDVQTGTPTPLLTAAGRPRGLALLPSGLLVMSDIEHHDIRLLDPATGVVTTLAGLSGCPGFADAPTGAEARFNRPYGVGVTAAGDILVADQENHRIRHISLQTGAVTTLAGDGTPDMVDGPISGARFHQPQDLVLDAQGNVFVSDAGNHRIRRLGISGLVETVAGDGVEGFADGPGDLARFFGQEGIIVTAGGALFVADGTRGDPGPYHRIRRIDLP